MTDTATRESGPVDAPASIDSVTAEIRARVGLDAPDNQEDEQEQVEDTEGTGDSVTEPEAEEATEPADDESQETEESTPDGTEDADPFAKLIATNPDLKVKVKVNGETIEVPLSELPNGYSRTEDYKAKTTAAAEAMREAEAVKANAHAEAQAQYANQLEEATNLFLQHDPVLVEAQRIDWATLKRTDPAAFVQATDAVNERLATAQRMQQQAEQARVQSQQQQQQKLEQERSQRFDKAAEEIVKLRPELADEVKFKAFAGETVEFLKGDGFTGEEIVDALDHRVLRLADDARRWRAHVAAQKSLPEKKVVPKSAVKPLTSDGSGSSQPRPRFPANASRENQLSWAVQQIRNQE